MYNSQFVIAGSRMSLPVVTCHNRPSEALYSGCGFLQAALQASPRLHVHNTPSRWRACGRLCPYLLAGIVCGCGLNERAVRYSEFSGHKFGFFLVRDETALANNFEEEGRRAGRALFQLLIFW